MVVKHYDLAISLVVSVMHNLIRGGPLVGVHGKYTRSV